MLFSLSGPKPSLEALLHRMTDRIRQSLELSEILSATATEVRTFLKIDRVKLYRFEPDGSGEVVAESIQGQRLPSLLGHRFPAEDIPQEARELFLITRQRHIVNVAEQEIGISPLLHPQTQAPLHQDIWFRSVDPCHVEYLTNMGVQSSLVVPVLHEQRLWGLLVAHHSTPRRISPNQLEVVQLVSDQVSVAIAHALLLSQSRLQARHEATVNQVVTLLHKTPTPALQTALTKTVKALSGVGGRLYLNTPGPNPKKQLLITGQQPAHLVPKTTVQSPVTDHQSYPSSAIAVPPLEQLLAWRSWLQSEAPAKPNELLWAIDHLPDSQASPLLKSALQLKNICGILVAQLFYRNQHLGYLTIFRQAIAVETIWAGRLDSTDPRQDRPRQSFETWRELKQGQTQPWASNDIDLAHTLAHHFAQVIYQSRLYCQIQALNTELEGRVTQRTKELQQANTDLKREIAERENTLRQLHLAQDSLNRLSHQNELILESAGEGICGLNAEGQIIFVNPAAAEILGYSREEMLDQLIPHLVDPAKADGTPYPWEHSPIFRTLHEGTHHHISGDLFRKHQGDYFPVEYTSAPIQDQSNILGAVVIFKDITERQIVERLKDEFISVVSHELRTPLTSIRTALGLLANDDLDVAENKRRRMMEIAFSNTNRLVRLVNDILDIERIKLGKVTLRKQACDLAKLIAQAVDEMRAIAEKKSINLVVSSLSINFWVDPDRIIQTLANLLSNAIKFSPPGSTVQITASFYDQEGQDHRQASSTSPLIPRPQPISLPSKSTIESNPKAIIIAVQDQGKGIPENKLETIFDQFEQLHVLDDEHQGGTGLGLAICRSIVQQHGGQIWAESTLDQGSTFFFTLPIYDVTHDQ
ncbi:GAF domain-containing protein [Nodosilinea sp. LEGE 07298]|uniref:ATP-binding protein n=1 Tax=Nodosilinea sp. LEGE 07298 TaxID=2777970 RepID=UPI00187F27C8|nr:ATP-binding protein [Nodosilinea sp. LEGE 07298]MBE9108695.1 GAF domain-containing protein [Nodosilinea sp. LEGE 07298]